ncbi:MAG TPA: hypothetical protein DIT07_16665, partial [Sphingobacteriaceae bacterium]|nr:hypothetical protein [Sphingobacteriaceae bacterium]
MNFENFTQLVNSINKDLGGFCNEFQYKRKELVDAGRTAGNNELFGNIKEDDGWAINRGGGTEVQFHIAFDKDELIIKYGLGFNTQYVPFAANLISPVDHLRPYMLAFLNLETEIVKILPDYNFIYGSIEQLQNPQFGQYNLFGKTCEVIENNSDFSIADVDYN